MIGPHYLDYVWDTAVLSAATTALALAASYPIAYALRARPRAACARGSWC